MEHPEADDIEYHVQGYGTHHDTQVMQGHWSTVVHPHHKETCHKTYQAVQQQDRPIWQSPLREIPIYNP